jgi:tetratricopeptide (TPR) repeat protein
VAIEFSSELISLVAQGDPFLIRQSRPVLQGIRIGRLGCRLEVLLEIARQGVGNHVLRVLSVLEQGLPNAYHYALATALQAGHTVITTNFDQMIERAYARLYPLNRLVVVDSEQDCRRLTAQASSRPLLFKVHGSLRDARGRTWYESIQMTLASLANGLSRDKRRLLEFLFHRRDIIFMGYSGRDDFDLTPFIMSATEAGRYFWSKYQRGRLIFTSSTELAQRKNHLDVIDSIVLTKDGSYTASGNTKLLLSMLPFFNLERVRPFLVDPPPADWRPRLRDLIDSLSLTSHQRIRYIAKVLQHNGHFPHAKRCLDRNVQQSKGLQRATALDDLAQYHFLLRDFDSDLLLRRQARELARKYKTADALNLVGRTWLGAAESYRNKSRYSKALTCFRKANSVYEDLDMPAKVGYGLAGMAGIYRMNSQFVFSERFSKKAITSFRKGKDLLGSLYAKWGLAELWKYRGFFERADRAYRSIREQAENLGYESLMGWAMWGQAEILRLSWRISEAKQMYTRAFETFSAHDLAGRSWSLEGRAQCKIIAGDSPTGDIQSAVNGFEALEATIGKVAATLDAAVHEMSRGNLSQVKRLLSRIQVKRLPLKDQANLWMVAAELDAHKGTDKSGIHYRRAIAAYKKLGMQHAMVSAIILKSFWHASNKEQLRRALVIARDRNYIFESTALMRIRDGQRATYSLNLY